MQALRLRIAGDYWDSLIYDGSLYLFRADGVMERYDWDSLIRRLAKRVSPDDASLVGDVLVRGRRWYSPEIRSLFASKSVRGTVTTILERLSREPLEIGRKDLVKSQILAEDMPTFPTTDLECFKSTIYCSSSDGIFESDPLRGRDSSVAFDRATDLPVAGIAASYGTLAAAAGDSGLFEMALDERQRYDWEPDFADPMHVSNRPATVCTWSQFDLVADDSRSGGYVAAFSRPEGRGRGRGAWGERPRSPLLELEEDELFHGRSGLLRGGSKSLLLATSDGTFVRRWEPYRRKAHVDLDADYLVQSEQWFEPSPRRDLPVDARIADFGIVYEYDSSLVVEANDGVRHTLRGEPANWRVFPRSQRYTNQLHVVRSSSLEVYAFWGDFFIESDARILGLPRPKMTAAP
jgi:hypothetical protein